ncbi:MAG: tRNA uridine-5-carboxymethylaminomethyl(34) synthesis enzyme MnmG [Thermoanaerobaculia bacterium]
MNDRYDVVIVGGGHAGCEAALAAARLGCETLLLTNDPATLARMSCNPAIGGLAKGQVVREIDALGGVMGIAADRTAIQFKVLNASRGPAVRGLRVQSDKALYSEEMTRQIHSAPGLSVGQGLAAGFLIEEGRLAGLRLEGHETVRCRSAVVTTGTFLRGLLHVGTDRRSAGRWGEPPAVSLSQALSERGLRLGRMKTGTPPRVRSASIDRERMQASGGDAHPIPFSFRTRDERFPRQPQVLCWLTHTSPAVHDLIRSHLGDSPVYSGAIVGRGPRYCPSIEDKVVRFADKERHQIFVEPEGLTTDWIYLNGLSMSLPPAVQEKIVRAIAGLERAEILRPAYAVEYDVVFPDQLDDSLELRSLPGLFLAGQINGTSGYEEAAGQGLLAGINAAFQAMVPARAPLVLRRDQAYIGVMVDDLVTQGAEEPYRLLSSRAEHRLLLGPESAYARLTPLAFSRGLLTEAEATPILEREALLSRTASVLESVAVNPDRRTIERLAGLGIPLTEATTLAGLFRRPDFRADEAREWVEESLPTPEARDGLHALDGEGLDRLVALFRYEGFLRREREAVRRVGESSERSIPAGFVYRGLPGLSAEAVEKLERHRPRTLGQAGRIPGVTPAAVTLLLARLTLARHGRRDENADPRPDRSAGEIA